MKTFVPSMKNAAKALVVLTVCVGSVINTNAQNSDELVFKNPVLHSGSAGSNGAVYKFPGVTNSMDALVKINGRSSSLVKLDNIDVTSSGFDKAFQPQVSYNNGSVSGSKSWWMEFEVTFVSANTTIPATVNTFDLTAIDIDGDGNRLREYVSLYNQSTYTLENNSQLQVTSLVETVLNLLTNVGKEFRGPSANYTNIDTSATSVMTTNKYQNRNSFRFRTGASTTGSTSSGSRLYSMWFKSFNYSAPLISTLPVKLSSFTAMLLNNTSKVELKWSTSTEKDASHFMIERSTDGTNFTDAGMVFAFGNSTENKSYSYTDNISSLDAKVIYYRLRSVDADGSFDYSATRIIRTAKQAENSISILTYPNPVTNELRVTIPNNWQGKKVTYEVIGANGMASKKVETGSSSQTETINVSSLATGFYVVRVICNGEIAQQKIVKK